jgi:hypothetical protein
MPIGATPSTAYTRAGAVGTLNGTSGAQVGASLKFYLITAKDNSASAVDLRSEDDATNEVFETIIRALPSGVLAYFAANAGTGVISVIVDGVNAPDASVVQTALRALGASVGANAIDLRGTTVADGVSFTVA